MAKVRNFEHCCCSWTFEVVEPLWKALALQSLRIQRTRRATSVPVGSISFLLMCFLTVVPHPSNLLSWHARSCCWCRSSISNLTASLLNLDLSCPFAAGSLWGWMQSPCRLIGTSQFSSTGEKSGAGSYPSLALLNVVFPWEMTREVNFLHVVFTSQSTNAS